MPPPTLFAIGLAIEEMMPTIEVTGYTRSDRGRDVIADPHEPWDYRAIGGFACIEMSEPHPNGPAPLAPALWPRHKALTARQIARSGLPSPATSQRQNVTRTSRQIGARDSPREPTAFARRGSSGVTPQFRRTFSVSDRRALGQGQMVVD
jgi:hypothetical protein